MQRLQKNYDEVVKLLKYKKENLKNLEIQFKELDDKKTLILDNMKFIAGDMEILKTVIKDLTDKEVDLSIKLFQAVNDNNFKKFNEDIIKPTSELTEVDINNSKLVKSYAG